MFYFIDYSTTCIGQIRRGGTVLPAGAGDLREQTWPGRQQRGKDKEQPRLGIPQAGQV